MKAKAAVFVHQFLRRHANHILTAGFSFEI